VPRESLAGGQPRQSDHPSRAPAAARGSSRNLVEGLSDQVQDDLLARLLTFPNTLVTSHQGLVTREALANRRRSPRGA
jgi:hypothetical protein